MTYINFFILEQTILSRCVLNELGRSKVSSRYQAVIPEKVRDYLNIKDLNKENEYYIYFYEKEGDVLIKAAIVETKEDVTFIKSY